MNPKRAFKVLREVAKSAQRNERGEKDQVTFHYPGGPRSAVFRSAPLVRGDHKTPLPYWYEAAKADFIPFRVVKDRWGEIEPKVAEKVYYYYPDAPNEPDLQRIMSYAGQADAKVYEQLMAELNKFKQEWLMSFAQSSAAGATVVHYVNRLKQFMEIARNPFKATRFLKKHGYAIDSRVVTVRGKTRKHVGYYLQKGSNEFFQVYYGVLPILSDIESAIQAFVHNEVVTITKDPVKVSAGVNFARNYVAGSLNAHETAVAGRTVRGYFEVTDPIPFLANYMGLTNPALAINDVIKFTYVANWFLGYERYLRALTDWQGLKFVGYMGKYHISQCTFTPGDIYTSRGQYDHTSVGQPGASVHGRYERLPINGKLTPPSLLSIIQQYGTLNPFTDRPMRSLAAVALVTQRLAPWLAKHDKQFKRTLKEGEVYKRDGKGWKRVKASSTLSATLSKRTVRSLADADTVIQVPASRRQKSGRELYRYNSDRKPLDPSKKGPTYHKLTK